MWGLIGLMSGLVVALVVFAAVFLSKALPELKRGRRENREEEE